MLAIQTKKSLVPSQEPTANDEFDKIIQEYVAANIVHEISRFRIWRLKSTERWKEIVNPDGSVKYPTWEDFVVDVAEQLNCGRQLIFERVRVYEQLHWLGYNHEESIKMVAERPSFYPRFFGLVLDWDQRAGKPRNILIPSAQSSTANSKQIIKDLIEDVSTFDTQKDALKFVSENILIEPQVDFWFDGDVIRCTYYNQYVDQNGDVHIGDSGTATYYPDKQLPAWAYEKLEKEFKTIGRFRQKDTADSP